MTTQTPWWQRTFHFDFPVELFPVLFSRLEGTIFRLHHLLANADEEQCSISKKGWSIKQHVGHLADVEPMWWQRLTDMLTGQTYLTEGDSSNAKTELANHNENSLEVLANQFLVARQKLLETIYPFNADQLFQTAIHPRLLKQIRLIDLLFLIAEHDDHHLATISTLLRKPHDDTNEFM
ncbi:MAG TPA: DinB family protein [Chitinophagaceae bacterium]|nr:DinB family protein [Chitinophagaceae bacterium]